MLYNNFKTFLVDSATVDTEEGGPTKTDILAFESLLLEATKLEKNEEDWQSLPPRGQQFLLTIIRILKQTKQNNFNLSWASPEEICVLAMMMDVIDFYTE